MSIEFKALEDICNIQIGKTPSRSENTFWRDGTHAWLSIADMNQGRYLNTTKECITDLGVKASNIKLIPKNTLVLSYKLSIGKVGITQKPMFTNEAIASLIDLSPQVDLNYLYWALQYIDLLKNADRAAMGKTLSKAKLKKLKIPLPPLTEQRRIAAILDQADELRQKRKQAIEKLDQLLQATFIDMFGDPISNPKGWERKSLEQISSFENGDRSKNYPKEIDLVPEGIPFLTTKNISCNTYNEASLKFITESKFKSLSRGKVKQNEILITLRGTLGATCLFDSEFKTAFINAQMMIIRSNPSIMSNNFLHQILSFKSIQEYFQRIGQGAAVPQLTAAQLKKMKVFIPSLKLQNSFLEIVKQVQKLKVEYSDSHIKSDKLLQSLQNQAFNGTL